MRTSTPTVSLVSSLLAAALAIAPLGEALAAPEGDGAAEETPEGETPEGETPEGETPEGETPEGETPEGETPKARLPKARPLRI